ncbi:hypothetical protein ACWGOQ_0022780 [Aquimarina sp. M1]
MGKFYHYNLDYCELFILENLIVKQIKEGEIISSKHITELEKIIEKHFKNDTLIYLSNRTFSYSVDPLVYKEASKIKNLLGIGIIVSNDNTIENAKFEGKFYEKDFEVFRHFDNAVSWAKKILSSYD